MTDAALESYAQNVRLAFSNSPGRFNYYTSFNEIQKSLNNVHDREELQNVIKVFTDKNAIGMVFSVGSGGISGISNGDPITFNSSKNKNYSIAQMLGIIIDSAARESSQSLPPTDLKAPWTWNDSIFGRILTGQKRSGSRHRNMALEAYKTVRGNLKLSDTAVFANIVVICVVEIEGVTNYEFYTPGTYHPTLDFVPIYMYVEQTEIPNPDYAPGNIFSGSGEPQYIYDFNVVFQYLNPDCIQIIPLQRETTQFFFDATDPTANGNKRFTV